jgi:phosphatidylglycerophosphatase A
MKPTLRFLMSDPAHFIALGFGSGLMPKGPGTAGTLAGWLLFPFVRAPLSDPLFGGLLLASFLFGILACERTGRALGVADHGGIVWDEIVAIWLVLWLTPPPWPGRPPPSCFSASSTSSSHPHPLGGRTHPRRIGRDVR